MLEIRSPLIRSHMDEGATGRSQRKFAPLCSSRRSLLATGVAMAAMLAWAPQCALAQQAGQNADSEFLQLSRLLCGRTALNAELASRLNAALSATHQGFPAQVAACASFARQHGITSVDELVAALDAEDKQLASVLHTILSAWYTGVVGDGPQARVIAYDEALMFSVVGDVLPAPSYCRAAPGYWTAKPPTT